MKKDQISTEQLVVTALMIALTVVLSKLLSINISFLRIGFGFLPVAILAILYGPVWSGAGYAIADVIGSFLFPTGKFFLGFTLSALITGVIFGLLLHKKEVTLTRSLIASALICLIVNLFLNTYWLTFIIGKAYGVLFASRVIKEVAAVPIMALLITISDRSVIKAIRGKSQTA